MLQSYLPVKENTTSQRGLSLEVRERTPTGTPYVIWTTVHKVLILPLYKIPSVPAAEWIEGHTRKESTRRGLSFRGLKTTHSPPKTTWVTRNVFESWSGGWKWGREVRSEVLYIDVPGLGKVQRPTLDRRRKTEGGRRRVGAGPSESKESQDFSQWWMSKRKVEEKKKKRSSKENVWNRKEEQEKQKHPDTENFIEG